MTSHNFGHFNPFFTLLGTMAYISLKERRREREGERERERGKRGHATSKTTTLSVWRKNTVCLNIFIAINFLWIKFQLFTKPKIQATENEFVISFF